MGTGKRRRMFDLQITHSLPAGITSIILHNLPYKFNGLETIATIIFVLNVVLFCFFLLM